VPSPRFSSSAIGDEIGADEEVAEIIGCIIHNDSNMLMQILQVTQLDVTEIRDSIGYTLMHMAAYNNSERSIEILIQAVLS